MPFFAGSFLLLLPTLFRLYRNRKDGWLTPRDIALMVILQGWPRILERAGSDKGTVVVLEEGAVCLLAKLQGSARELLKSEDAKRWWRFMCKKWAETIDLVIRLDAPIPILVERIRARGMAHEIDALADEEATEYLTHIRAAEEHVLSALMTMARRPEMLCLSTMDGNPDRLCDEVLAFGLEHRDEWPSPDTPANGTPG